MDIEVLVRKDGEGASIPSQISVVGKTRHKVGLIAKVGQSAITIYSAFAAVNSDDRSTLARVHAIWKPA